jgi:CHAD domain-containing protein
MAKAKQIIGIDCDGPAHIAIAHVLNTRMDEMCAFREYALDSRDPGGVHDMRVASRRLRTALRDFTPYLEKKRFANSLKNIKSLALALGRVRDHDVAIITLKKTATKAPPEISDGILRFVELRHRAREEAFVGLAQVLECDGLSRLKARLEEALDATIERAPGKEASWQRASATARLTYREVARSTILGHLKDLERRSQSLYRPSQVNKVKPLHRVRIAAKHFRYALEFFDQCWGQRTALFAKKLAALQSALGELHDCDVWIKSFGDEAICDLRPFDVNKKATSAWLVLHFVKLRTKHFRRALQQWNEWESNDFGSKLKTILSNSRDSVLK